MSQITGPVFGIFGGQTNDGESQWRVATNQALAKIDATISLSVINNNQLVVPENPVLGDRYSIGSGASGVFSGKANQLAVYGYSTSGATQWNYYTPINGLVAYELSTTYTWVYDTTSASWIPKPVASTAYIIPNVGTVSGTTASVSGGSETVIDTIDKLTFSSAKYTIQVKYTTNYQVVELLVTSDGTIAQYTEYAKLKSNLDLGTFSVAISGNNIQLKFLPSNSGSMTLRIMRTAIYI